MISVVPNSISGAAIELGIQQVEINTIAPVGGGTGGKMKNYFE